VPALQRLHPSCPLPTAAPPPQEPFQARVENVLAALKTFPPGTAGGRDGLRALHIKHALSVGGSDLLLESLLSAVNRALAGDISPCPPLSSGQRTYYSPGQAQWRSAAHCCGPHSAPLGLESGPCRCLANPMRLPAAPPSWGGGSEAEQRVLFMLLTAWSPIPIGPRTLVVATLDFENAFNTIGRMRMLQEVAQHCPTISAYVNVTYGCAARLVRRSPRC